MSTIALWPVAAATAPTVGTKGKPSLFQRIFQGFVKAQEAGARRRIHSFLAGQSDERLADLGYTAEDIETMRQGLFRFPAR